ARSVAESGGPGAVPARRAGRGPVGDPRRAEPRDPRSDVGRPARRRDARRRHTRARHRRQDRDARRARRARRAGARERGAAARRGMANGPGRRRPPSRGRAPARGGQRGPAPRRLRGRAPLMVLGLLPAIRGGLGELARTGQHARLIDGYLKPYARGFEAVRYFSYLAEALDSYTTDPEVLARGGLYPGGGWHPWADGLVRPV